MTETNIQSETGYRRLAAVLAIAAVAFVLWRAWVCDDAFITFRYVRNCLDGHGPVFNVGERVQGYTHPLWFGVLLAGSLVANTYAVAVAAGLACTAGVVLALANLLRRGRHAALALTGAVFLLLASPTFVEFQTSGLENGLSNLLLVLLVATLLTHREAPAPPVGRSALLISLLLLNRPDSVFLCVPVFVWLLAWARRPRARLRFLAAAAPLVLWYGFATVYYGSPLPNTAYAKVALPWSVALGRGGQYLLDYLMYEPFHVLLVVGAVFGGAAWAIRNRRDGEAPPVLALCVGIGLHVLYVLQVGGDFMRGRFLLIAVVGATGVAAWLMQRTLPAARANRRFNIALVALLSAAAVRKFEIFGPSYGSDGSVQSLRQLLETRPVPAMVWLAATALAAVLGLRLLVNREVRRPLALAALAVFSAGIFSVCDVRPRPPLLDSRTGIADEYSVYRGRWHENRFRPPPTYPNRSPQEWVEMGLLLAEYSRRAGPVSMGWTSMGLMPFHAGSSVSVFDVYGLTDAFVARCPAKPEARVGHIDHFIPQGYLQSRAVLNTVADFRQRLERMDLSLADEARQRAASAEWPDPAALQFWRDVQMVTSGPIWSRDRLAKIPAFALGRRLAAEGAGE